MFAILKDDEDDDGDEDDQDDNVSDISCLCQLYIIHENADKVVLHLLVGGWRRR